MFSQTSMTNRRQFLERSALGFGGAFLLPSLLTSCNDHRIPDPDLGTDLPDAGITIDWKALARSAVIAGIKKIPEVGEILGPLAETYWPDNKPSVWEQVRAETEALINEKIADTVYHQVSEDLGSLTPIPSGLAGNINTYRNYLKEGTPTEIHTAWIYAVGAFTQELQHFQSTGYEVLLLPLFAQFANLYLSLLREPLIPAKDSQGNPILDANGNPELTGTTWGRTPGDLLMDITNLKTHISAFTDYAKKTFNDGRSNVVNNTKVDLYNCQPFISINAYERQMTLSVLDFRETWPYYDITQYPNGAKNPDGTDINLLTREIYSEAFGSFTDSGPVVIASPVPTKLPTNITVWAGDRIDAVQVFYPGNTGPGGADHTPRMGATTGSNQPPLGDVIHLSPQPPLNPIVACRVVYGPNGIGTSRMVELLQFSFNDGSTTATFGGKDNLKNRADTGWFGYPDEALSSIYIPGIAKDWNTPNSIVFGFQYWDSPAATLRAIRGLYVTSPKEHSAADLVKAFPNVAIPAGLITEELKAARLAHWASVQARAKALK